MRTRHHGKATTRISFSVYSMSRDKAVDDPWTRFDRVRWLLFHRLLRAGNFKFDYKLPARSLLRRVFCSVSPRPPVSPPPFHCRLCYRHPFSRARPDEKLSSPDCDGIIGRPALFMVFIFLKIAASPSLVDIWLFFLLPFIFYPFLIFSNYLLILRLIGNSLVVINIICLHFWL